jgi:hypothetical protein
MTAPVPEMMDGSLYVNNTKAMFTLYLIKHQTMEAYGRMGM